MVARFALRDNRTLFLFVFTAGAFARPAARDLGQQKAILRRLYAGGAWEPGACSKNSIWRKTSISTG